MSRIARRLAPLLLALLALPAPAGAALPLLAPGSTPTIVVPAHTRPAPLSRLWHLAATHRVSAVTLNTTLDVAYYRVGDRRYVSQFVPSTAGLLSVTLLREGVDVSVSTAATLSGPSPFATGDGGFPWPPIIGITLALALMVVVMVRGGHWRWRPHRRARAGVHHAGSTAAAEFPEVTFGDVAGNEEAKADLVEIVQFFTDPERFAAVGATIPKGALLCGPPGTGKTLLARAVAGEAGVAFFHAAASDFAEMYVGVGPKRVRELFARAKKAGRAIVFIDEIDAVGRRRAGGAQDGADSERDNTLIALLEQMDGFTSSEVVVLAATNRPEVLDGALTRPGRLDRRIEIPLPDRRGREQILAVHCRTRPVSPTVDLHQLASATAGLSGADLARLVNESAMAAARESATMIEPRHVDAALLTVTLGRARESALVTPRDREITAWHEAGHAVCAYLQEAVEDPVSVTIIPRGVAGGVTAMGQSDDHFLTRSAAAAQLVTALGGRAAERRLLGDDYTQGAHGDLTTATRLATSMVTHFGMTGHGLVVRDPQLLGPTVVEGVTEVVDGLLARALAEAERILEGQRAFVEAVVESLVREDTLRSTDLDAIYRSLGEPARVPSATTLAALFPEAA